MRWIIDASAGIRITLNRGLSDQLSNIIKNNLINAPAIYVSETGNGLWKYVLYQNMSRDEANILHQRCLELVDNIIPAQVFRESAMNISTSYRITFYDALYLTLAQMQNCGIISFDRKLVSVAKILNIKTFEPNQEMS